MSFALIVAPQQFIIFHEKTACPLVIIFFFFTPPPNNQPQARANEYVVCHIPSGKIYHKWAWGPFIQRARFKQHQHLFKMNSENQKLSSDICFEGVWDLNEQAQRVLFDYARPVSSSGLTFTVKMLTDFGYADWNSLPPSTSGIIQELFSSSSPSTSPASREINK